MSAALLGLGFNVITPSHASKLVLLKLVDACDDDGSNIFPAVATIAKKAQCSERQVQRELKRFQRIGLLILVEPGGRGPGDTAKYRLDVPTMMRIADGGWPSDDPEEARSEATGTEGDESAEKGDTVSPIAKGDTSDAKGDIGDIKGDRACHPTPPINPSLDPSDERERAREREARAEGASVPSDKELLNQALALHPTVAHDSQAEIRRAWLTLTRAERSEAVARLPEWLGEKRGRTHVAGLPTYLAERRWTLLKSRSPAPAQDKAAAFSAPWWWLFFAFLEAGAAHLRDARSPASVELAKRINLALRYAIGWPLGEQSLAAIEADAKALKPIAKSSAAVRAWSDYVFAAIGLRLPLPDKAEWIYVPSEYPPDEREQQAQLADEAAEIMGVEG